MGAPRDCEFCGPLGPGVAFGDDTFLVLIARYQPTGPGYALLVPKDHVADLHDWPRDAAPALLAAISTLCRAVEAAFGVTGTTVTINVGPPGQRVPHLHVHVVPRRPDDGYPSSASKAIDEIEMAHQATLLGEVLRATEYP